MARTGKKLSTLGAALVATAAFTGAANAQYREFTDADACVGGLMQKRVEQGMLDGKSEIYMDAREFGGMKTACEEKTGTHSAYYKERRDMKLAVPPPQEYAPY